MPKAPPKNTDNPTTGKPPTTKPSSQAAKASKSNRTSSNKGKGSKSGGAAPANGKSKPAAREVLYDSIKSKLFLGDSALTVDNAKKLIGWMVAPEGAKQGLYVFGKHKVFLTNNLTNRPLYLKDMETYKQELLRGKWKFNGEPIIIGKTGLVLNGQHQLVALILAEEERAAHPEKYVQWWRSPITMPKLVVFGVDEDDATVNTMDTCKPRSLTDVIYRSEYFAKLPTKDRKQVSRIADYAVRLLWYRTGAGMVAMTKRTHAESLDFINRHPTLLKCVKHIYEENGDDNKLNSYLSLGYSSALMYLMGCALTDREKEDKTGYIDVDLPDESCLDWTLYDQASEFFVLLASGKELTAVKQAIAALISVGNATYQERMAILVKAWNTWTSNKAVTLEALELNYQKGDEGELVLAETPTVGGIDIGHPS